MRVAFFCLRTSFHRFPAEYREWGKHAPEWTEEEWNKGAPSHDWRSSHHAAWRSRNARRADPSRLGACPFQSRKYRDTAAGSDDRTVPGSSAPSSPCLSLSQVSQSSPAAEPNRTGAAWAAQLSPQTTKKEGIRRCPPFARKWGVVYRESRLGAASRAAGTLPARLISGRMPALRSMSSTAREIWRPTRESLAISRSSDVMPLMTVE